MKIIKGMSKKSSEQKDLSDKFVTKPGDADVRATTDEERRRIKAARRKDLRKK